MKKYSIKKQAHPIQRMGLFFDNVYLDDFCYSKRNTCRKGDLFMSECKLNHTHEDVKNKFVSVSAFLPEDMKPLFDVFFSKEHTQDLLNDVFHLLKKYDLASEKERTARNNRLYLVLKNV